tara:strand:+ start:4980 stop:5264 length:285 start_codon:yes stop_codon:yes gene_type:complete
MAYSTINTPDGLVVESEINTATLKVYSPLRGRRLFTCQISHAGNRLARISNGSGQYSFKIRVGIQKYLKSTNFSRYTFERGNPEDGLRPLEGEV